jgi:RHS repeat-associated protein
MLSTPNNKVDGSESSKEQNYFSSPPSISLPKGGGAIKGMGDKFAANPVTGTGSMSVPISTTPGRSGFAPQLSLSYDSGAGNGIFGMGWGLSLPTVTRKTDKGLPRYWDAEESDVFILSGAEDLVPILKTDGTIAEIPRDGYLIRQYRPRIEGLFARIERWTKIDSGQTHWRSLSKDNITTLYGKTENSRIADPKYPTHVFSWLICESYDDKGNAIHYRYKAEDSEGVSLAQAHERDRTPESRSANRHLKHIYYGNSTPREANEDLNTRQDWLFEVVFDYGEHDLDNPSPKEPTQWTTDTLRPDPFSSYRSGFEVRTYRLCRRVLMFHHFENEAGVGKDCLVRSTDFEYASEKQLIYSFLKSVTQTGYKRQNGGGYLAKSLPPLELTYTEPIIDDRVWNVDPQSLENLPQGLDGTRYQWVDLDGEGLSGILTEQGNGWFYKRNLSPINPAPAESGRIEAKFAAVATVATKPASGLANGAQFLDLAGDGQLDVAILRGETPGFYERTPDEGWATFIPFKSLPNADWEDPNLKFIDLDGDGRSDILIMEGDCFKWHASLAEDGFGAAERVYQPVNEEKGARVVFADSTQSIYLADMSGDGLTDIVRIRNGEVCYWSNLGYGKFGTKVTMDDSPWFDRPDIFNQRRVLLADIDGSGTTDILYLSGEGVQIYFNQSGNSWAQQRVLPSFPAIDSIASVTTLDLLGNGTACLVWSSPLPGDARQSMRYIDLMGGQKPHLLIKTNNNMGAETVVEYAPSTKFYLEDWQQGKPWITKLPFPVHVVERVETYDRISNNRFVSRHAYHHGYFDGVEREFRGFGMVEQWDTEEIGTILAGDSRSDATNLDKASFIPPVLTKTWFHTGAYLGREKISQQFEQEYYREPNRSPDEFQASLLPDTILPDGLTVDEEREAARSLKGSILRQEIYALDGSDKEPHPYKVSEQNYTIELVQQRGNLVSTARQENRHAVFFVHPRTAIEYLYERNPLDPRITQAMTLEVDEFGNVLKSVAIAYPRRQPAYPEQGKTLITYTENRVTNKPNEVNWYRIGVPIETITYELMELQPTTDKLFALNDFYQRQADGTVTGYVNLPAIDYEVSPTVGQQQKRAIEHIRTLYRRDSEASTTDPTPLALGEIESLALPCESFKLAFTPGLLTQVYGSKLASSDLENEGKYVQQDGGWWIPAGRQAFAADRFYLPIQIKDPFGNLYSTTYDSYHLLGIRTEDPLQNVVQIKNNYRVMQPQEIVDPNGNRSQVAFDALGMVVGTAVMGKATETIGDSLTNFNADLTQAEIKAFFEANNPRSLAIQHLGTATTRIIYDLDSDPVCAAAIARETHVSDLGSGQTKVQLSFVYSDGFGREVQTKVQAEPGFQDPSVANSPILDPRWVGTGAKVYNNKGKPVRQYEPFFSPTHKFGIEQWGVSSTLFYDPVERVVATLHPNHTWEKVVFDPWQQETWDVNDTVTIPLQGGFANDPKTDPDVGGFLSRVPDDDYLPTWYQQRISGALGTEEKSAAEKAAKHADTPTIAHMDTLGRTFLTIADNGAAGKYETRVNLDIEGNQRAVIDAKGRIVMKYDYDMLGDRIHQASMEAGDRWMLNNVAGKPMRMWDSRNHIFRTTYDELIRPIEMFVKTGNDPEILTEKTIYGEGQGDANNLRGKIYQHFDRAGVVTSEAFDFKGNLLSSTRQLVQDYKNVPDWAGNPVLETEIFSSSTRFDALNRPLQLIAPHSNKPDTKLNIIRPGYNEANLLERMDVWLGEATEPTALLDPQSANFQAVKNIDRDAKGQRTLIEYGNGAKTEYTYNKNTFRLTRMKTTRGSAVLQDLFYTYDPVGNITRIRDDAQQTIYFNNQVVLPHCDYSYDPIYRLIEAAGREHIGQVGQRQETKWDDEFRVNLPHPSDGQAMRNYSSQYIYDAVGNFEKLIHQAANGNWTRAYAYNEASLIEPGKQSNRLSSTSVGQSTEPYSYDAHGNMTSMPHLSLMEWNYKDELSATARQVANNGVAETTFYVYDASGERVRKVTEGQNGKRKHERIYLGGFEIYREFQNDGDIKLERETLHVMDDRQRIALVETKTITNPDDESPTQLIRYQLGNHLGSASLELDDRGNVISYEEYYPYGSTAYQTVDKGVKAAAKRYRYTGMERDEETGLNYHSARYYAAWLGRWVSCDPIEIEDGNNLYCYALCSPTILLDPNGFQSQPNDIDIIKREKFTGKETQEQMREKYAALGIYYKGNAEWNEKLKSWLIDRSQLITGSPSHTEKPPSDTTQSPTTGEKAAAVAKGVAEGLATGIAIEVGVGILAGLTGIAAGTIGLFLAVVLVPVAIYGIATHWDEITATASRLYEGTGTLEDYEAAGEVAGGLLSIGAAGPASKVGVEIGQAARAAGKETLETLASVRLGPKLATEGGPLEDNVVHMSNGSGGNEGGTPPRTKHGEQRSNEARQGDTQRQVGDANRVIREGRKFADSDTGYTIHVSGDRVVITNESGQIVTQFRNTKANTLSRIQSGKWVPK